MSLRRNKNKGKETGRRGVRSKQNKGIKRVADIILNSSHPSYISRDSLGTIFFTDEKISEISQNTNTLPTAIPSNRGNVTYPDIGDLVRIESGPSGEYYPDIGGSKKTQTLYYTGPISVHNNTSDNSLPLVKNAEEYDLGRKVNENIKPLNPEAGGTLIEGKNGQRLRFGSVGPEGSNAVSIGATEDPNDGNPTIGSKVMHLSLGEGTFENITQDAASIVLLEDSSLPIDTASTNIDSLKSSYSPAKNAMEELEEVPETPLESPLTTSPESEETIIDFTTPESAEEKSNPLPVEEDDPFDDPVFNALDEAIDEGILTIITPEEFEYDSEYIIPEPETPPDVDLDLEEGEDPALIINSNKFGDYYPGISTKRGPEYSERFCPAFKKYRFTAKDIKANNSTPGLDNHPEIKELITSGDLVMVADANLYPNKYADYMKSAIILDKKYYLHKTCASAFINWTQEMDQNNINYRLTSALRFGSNTGGGPHGLGLAVDFGNLHAELANYDESGSTKAKPNRQLRINSQTYKDIATIGAKYGWYNPWRLCRGFSEVWHFEYWGEPLA